MSIDLTEKLQPLTLPFRAVFDFANDRLQRRGLLLVLAAVLAYSAVGRWMLLPPMLGNLQGVSAPLLAPFRFPVAAQSASFGTLILWMAALLALYALWGRVIPALECAFGITVIWLFWLFVNQVLFLDTDAVAKILQGWARFETLFSFIQSKVDTNAFGLYFLASPLPLASDDPASRTWAMLSMLREGWYAGVIAGIALVVSGFASSRERWWEKVLTAALILLGCAVITAGMGFSTLRSGARFQRATELYVSGDFSAAREGYEHVWEMDPPERYNNKLFLRLGRCDLAQSDLDSAFAEYFRGLTVRGTQYSNYHLKNAVQKLPNEFILKGELSNRYQQLGLRDFDDKRFYNSRAWWALATETDPAFHELNFYKAVANFRLRDMQPALVENELFLDACVDRMLDSEALNNMGDCYAYLEEPVLSKEKYWESLFRFLRQNERAIVNRRGY